MLVWTQNLRRPTQTTLAMHVLCQHPVDLPNISEAGKYTLVGTGVTSHVKGEV